MPQHKNPSDLPGAKYLLFSFVQLTKIEFTSFGFNTAIKNMYILSSFCASVARLVKLEHLNKMNYLA